MRFRASAILLLRPTAFGGATLDLVVLAALALAVVLVSSLSESTSAASAVDVLRRAGVVAAIGTVRFLREPAGLMADSYPVSRSQRWLLRVLYLLLACSVVWSMLVLVAESKTEVHLPSSALALEFATVVIAINVLAELLRTRLPGEVAATAAPPIILAILFALGLLLPAPWNAFPRPEDAGWARSHFGWALGLLIETVAVAMLARDPGRPKRELKSRFLRRAQSTEARERDGVLTLRD